ncbi:hypothetical protein [Trueperella pyogenes]|uniref:hypothetical protein n=1 Tax=Trueperella pyogenes TaxID=1661 RepID=UPI0023DDE29D|nr:hypothetical protein [Trueperella pyogenes]
MKLFRWIHTSKYAKASRAQALESDGLAMHLSALEARLAVVEAAVKQLEELTTTLKMISLKGAPPK